MPDDQTRILLDAAEQAGILGHGKTSTVTLYKCVHEDYTSRSGRQPLEYRPGEIVVAPDYDESPSCGHGLHFHPTIEAAREMQHYGRMILECEVDLATLVPIHEKCKARSCRVVRIVENNYKREDDES